MEKKLFLSTDWHFGIYPLNLDKWLKMMREYFYGQFIPDLRERVNEGDLFIMLGDLYDNRTSIPILVMNEVEKILVEISKIIPMHLIIGNHDKYDRSSNNSINSPNVLNWIPNINIHTKTTILNFEGKKIVLMPWVEKKSDQIKELQNNRGDYLLCHSDLNGAKMHLNSVGHKNMDKIDVEAFTIFKHCYSGHYHIRSEMKNFTFIGSPYQMDRNDYGDKKGMTILYPDGRTEFVENRISPIFEKVCIKKEDDIFLLENINTKNYIDLEINNSLLINNRKIRKKIESVLETGSFAKVDYINDLVKEKVNTMDLNINVDSTNTSDFNKIIFEYLNKKEFESDKIKQGVMQELNNILKLHKDMFS